MSKLKGKREDRKWITVYLPVSLETRLNKLADEVGLPRNQVANLLLNSALDYWEKGLLELKIKPKKRR